MTHRIFQTLLLWLILATCAGCLAGFYHALMLSEPKFHATAVIVMDAGPGPVLQLTDFLPTFSTDRTVVNTELEVLSSASLAEDVVMSAGLTRDREFNPALRPPRAPARILERARALLDLPAPAMAAEAEGQSTMEALRRATTVRNVPDSTVFEITVETGDPAKSAALANLHAERYLDRQLEAKFDATERATTWLATKVAELEVELERSETALNAFVAEMELINADTLETLTMQLKDVRDRISAWEAAIARGEQNGQTNSRIAQLRLLESDLAERITRQTGDLVAFEQLQRETAANRQIYEFFLNRLKETAAQEGILQADARLLSAARAPDRPARPQPMLSAALAAILVTAVMAVWLVLRDARSATFRTAEDLEEVTGLPVLGQIPVIPARRRQGLLTYLSDKPRSAAAEAIRNLRTAILMSDPDAAPRVILSTSSLPGEGKTTQTLALAQSLTGIRGRVLVIEGDVRKRVFRDYFNAPETAGLVEVMTGKAALSDAVWHAEQIGVDILFGSDSRANPADLFSSRRFARLMQQARKSYDAVVIDAPPVLLVPDACIIATHADVILYTVRWDRTREKQVLAGLKALRGTGTQVCGLVLGQINPRGMRRYGYGKDFGTYGAAGYYRN